MSHLLRGTQLGMVELVPEPGQSPFSHQLPAEPLYWHSLWRRPGGEEWHGVGPKFREQGCSSLPRLLTPGSASQGQGEPSVFMGFHPLRGVMDFRRHPPLFDLLFACSPNVLPLPQISSLGHMAGVGFPVVGRTWDGLPTGCFLCLEHTPGYLLSS